LTMKASQFVTSPADARRHRSPMNLFVVCAAPARVRIRWSKRASETIELKRTGPRGEPTLRSGRQRCVAFRGRRPGRRTGREIVHGGAAQWHAIVDVGSELGRGVLLLMATTWRRVSKEDLGRPARLSIDLVSVDTAQAIQAGEIKAVHKIPYVDCAAAALAILNNATLVTSDRDFEKLGRRCSILWIARR
jgi:predicted nucleic acid-binding protein